MAKTVLLALLPALLIATGWQRLEHPAIASDFSLAATLAILAVLVPQRWIRSFAGVAAFVAVASLGFGLSPLDARPFDGDHNFVGPLLTRFGSGVVDFYELALPFDPVERERMHGVIVLAVFAFTMLATLAIRERRPILATAATLAGAAWPVTLVPGDASTTRGALILVTALLLLAGLRPGARRGSGQALLVGAGVVVAAVVAVSSPSVAKGGFLDWQNWQPYSRLAEPVSVQYVWDANYEGINFPRKPTTVLKVKAPRRAPYWRATTLDVFLDDRWIEDAELVDPVSDEDGARDTLVLDRYLPPQASQPVNWMAQEVTVEALQDRHLVAASVPVAFEEGAAAAYGSGIAYVGRLHRGQDYRAWSFAAQPTPEELTNSKAIYPDYLQFESPFLSVGTSLPPFGTPGREAAVQEAFGLDTEIAQYEPLYRVAQRVVGRPRNPYAAVVALEAWFRTSGEFTYDERPPVNSSAPPLVSFVDGHRRGYCQHFAGAMALMLRYLGIPARVAAGFTSGSFDQDNGEFTVSDTNAHAWVEVWFDGYGWLPFDPTPGRGRLRASYTASSLFFDADAATAAFAGVAAAALGLTVLRDQLGGGTGSPDDRTPRDLDPQTARDAPGGATSAPDEQNDLRLLGLLLLLAAGVVMALWLAKFVRRRVRYLTSDPRRVAAAVRAELVDYLADQRLRVPASGTPAELSDELREALRVDADSLAGALGAARFGPDDEAEYAARKARRELRTVLQSVRRRLSAKARLRGLLSLRSFGFRST